MTGFLPVAALRFREALAGRMAWLVPLHFVLALATARAMPGPTPAARLQAADATALALVAVIALVVAAVLGAGPLPVERERARGTLLLAAPVTATARVLGTAFGTGMALLLLLLGLSASAMAAVDLGVGGTPREPTAWVRAVSFAGGEPDPAEPGLVWLTAANPSAHARFQEPQRGAILVEARPRIAGTAAVPGWKKARFQRMDSIPNTLMPDLIPDSSPDLVHVQAGLHSPFRVPSWSGGAYSIWISRVDGNFDLGLRLDGIRADAGPRPRAYARLLHAGSLLAGLLAVMLAATALSTVTGTGVAAAGAIALALLSLFRSVFSDAAATLVHAGSMARAIEASEHAGHLHAEALTGTPVAFAPVFRAVAAVLPDGTRFDLSAAVAAGEVPDPGEAGRAVLLGLTLAALFLLLATLGARRRP